MTTIHIINPNNPIQIEIQDIVDSIQYIALETSEKCLLSDIKRIVKEKDFFFVHDSKGLFAFNAQGRFINEIGHRGVAPNEYMYIDCFFIDRENQHISIVCNGQKRIMQYTYDGIYLSSLALDKKDANIQYAVACENDRILAHYPLPDGVSEHNIEYCLFNKKENKLVATPLLKAVDITTNNRHVAISDNPIARFDKKYIFLSSLSNEIYALAKEEAIPIYGITFPNSCPTSDYLKEHKGWDFFKLRDLMEKQNIGLGITALEESTGHLFASINNKLTLIWDKHQAILLSRTYNQDLNLFSDLILPGGVSNEHIGFHSADFLCQIRDFICNGKNTRLKSIIHSLSDEDNPIIYKYYFKKEIVKLLIDKYNLSNDK